MSKKGNGLLIRYVLEIWDMELTALFTNIAAYGNSSKLFAIQRRQSRIIMTFPPYILKKQMLVLGLAPPLQLTQN